MDYEGLPASPACVKLVGLRNRDKQSGPSRRNGQQHRTGGEYRRSGNHDSIFAAIVPSEQVFNTGLRTSAWCAAILCRTATSSGCLLGLPAVYAPARPPKLWLPPTNGARACHGPANRRNAHHSAKPPRARRRHRPGDRVGSTRRHGHRITLMTINTKGALLCEKVLAALPLCW